MGGCLAWALCLAACEPTPPPPPQHPSPLPEPAVPIATIAAEPDTPAPQLDSYGTAFVRSYEQAQRLGEPSNTYGPGEAENIEHWVVQFAAPGRPDNYLTVGFGRSEQRNALGSIPKRVELLAVIASDQDADVVNILSRLGGWLHSADRTMSERFAAFQTLRTDDPLEGMRYFVLVPGGEVTLFEQHDITVLRVIPMAEDEYAYLKMRGDGAARAWWYRHRSDPALARRWSSAVPVPFVPHE